MSKKWFKKIDMNFIYIPNSLEGLIVWTLFFGGLLLLANHFNIVNTGFKEGILFLCSSSLLIWIFNKIASTKETSIKTNNKEKKVKNKTSKKTKISPFIIGGILLLILSIFIFIVIANVFTGYGNYSKNNIVKTKIMNEKMEDIIFSRIQSDYNYKSYGGHNIIYQGKTTKNCVEYIDDMFGSTKYTYPCHRLSFRFDINFDKTSLPIQGYDVIVWFAKDRIQNITFSEIKKPTMLDCKTQAAKNPEYKDILTRLNKEKEKLIKFNESNNITINNKLYQEVLKNYSKIQNESAVFLNNYCLDFVKTTKSEINSFEDCVNAGYEVLYPDCKGCKVQCIMPDQRIFTKESEK